MSDRGSARSEWRAVHVAIRVLPACHSACFNRVSRWRASFLRTFVAQRTLSAGPRWGSAEDRSDNGAIEQFKL